MLLVRLSNHRFAVYGCAILAAVVGTVTVSLLVDPWPAPADAPSEVVVDMWGTELMDGTGFDGQGPTYSIDSGRVEIVLTNQIVMNMIGPTAIDLRVMEGCELTAGTLYVVVPPTTGFHVERGGLSVMVHEGQMGIIAHRDGTEVHILDGRAEVAIDGATYPIEAGEALLVAGGVPRPVPLKIDNTFYGNGHDWQPAH